MTTENGSGTSRSDFLKQAAGATLAVAGAGVGAGAIASGAEAANGFTSGKFSLELDGVNCGAIAGVTGGDLDYDVVRDVVVGSDGIQRKHIGQPKYEDFTIQIGSNMSEGFYSWIQDSWDKKYVRKNGAIIAADFNYKEKARREFTDALITEVTIPALDTFLPSGVPVRGTISVKFSAASVADVPGSGAPVIAAKHKAWLCSNFRLIVQGVDTTRVASIDSFTWKQSVQADGSVVLDAGDIGVSFPPASMPSWRRWYNNFAVGGDATDERNGTLELVGQDGTVLDISLFNLGLYRLDPNAGAGIKRVKAELYIERLLPTVNK